MSKPARQLRGTAARLGRLMPAQGPNSAARTPFVLLVVALLGGGLITLLVLNSALNAGSFKLSEYRRQTTELTDEQQALQRDVDDLSAPDALARRAGDLGMVPGGNPVFLGPDGTVKGVPTPAGEPSPAEAAEPSPLPAAQNQAPAPPRHRTPAARPHKPAKTSPTPGR
ncbi:septum formation initiator [Streptomyces sp. NBC_00083]|uniref:septum formation initiator n=1 Tax=Streptomyces sp. NBC_00083 TaxID=2975647 RepID=UPI00225331B9|nr:septum formation initiator [Streptomyces sp. NBC_00083]MCX5382962.1 septum formation initiator [Streptomyces sp. NBC_00083]